MLQVSFLVRGADSDYIPCAIFTWLVFPRGDSGSQKPLLVDSNALLKVHLHTWLWNFRTQNNIWGAWLTWFLNLLILSLRVLNHFWKDSQVKRSAAACWAPSSCGLAVTLIHRCLRPISCWHIIELWRSGPWRSLLNAADFVLAVVVVGDVLYLRSV